MKILHLCPTMARAGTWFRCLALARGLVRRGHDVTLVKISGSRRLLPALSREDGVRLIETPRFWGSRFSFRNTRLPSDLLVRLGHVLVEPFDVVHTFSHHLNAMLPGLAARYLRRRGVLVADWDDLWNFGGLNAPPGPGRLERWNHAFDSWSERHLKRFADAVTVVSEELAERALADGIAPARLHRVGNGAPVDELVPADRDAARRALGLPLDRAIALYNGYSPHDVALVLDALVRLRAEGRAPLTVFTGASPEIIAADAARRGLSDGVRVTGFLPAEALHQQLAAADVGLVPVPDTPFNRARWPIRFGDALAAGLPVVTCRVGEIGRIAAEQGVGVATGSDVAAFARGITQLLAHPDPVGLRRHVRGVAERLSWAHVVERLDQAYQACARA